MNLEAAVIRDQLGVEIDAAATNAVSAVASQPALAAAAVAERRASLRLERTGAAMIGKPLGFDGLPRIMAEQAALEDRGNAMVARQNAAIARADRFGRRSGLASRGLILVATAAALFTLASRLREPMPAWLALATGTILLAASVATGVLALAA